MNCQKILVCMLRHHGDVLMTTPVFSALKRRFPSAHIDAYIYSETTPMLDGHPAVDGFVLYDKAWKKQSKIYKAWQELKLLWRIRKNRYDMVVNLTEGDRGALAAFVSGAGVRAGIDPEGGGMWGKARCFTHMSKPVHGPRHAVERKLDVLRSLGIEDEDKELFFQIDEAYEPPISEYVLIHPVSRWLFKCWPMEKVAALIDKLDTQVILTSSPDRKELELLARLEELCPGVINLGGKISLKQLGTLIAKSQLLVTVDSVPLHIASALKAPCVAIFGPTSEVNWAPYRNPHARVVTKPMPCRPCFKAGCNDSGRSECLETLELEAVLDAVHSLKLAPR